MEVSHWEIIYILLKSEKKFRLNNLNAYFMKEIKYITYTELLHF